MAKRGWAGWLAVGITAAAACAMAVSAGRGDHRSVATVFSHATGAFSISMPITFDSSRTILSGTYRVGGQHAPAWFYDDDSYVDGDIVVPATVPAGHHITVSTALLNPPCATGPTPVLVVRSRAFGGKIFVDRFATAPSAAWDAAVRRWCSHPLYAHVSGATISPHHWAVFRLQLINSTARPIRVVSEAFGSPTTHWLAASVVIPPHETRTLAVRGEGAVREPRPWYAGHLLADGKVVHVGR